MVTKDSLFFKIVSFFKISLRLTIVVSFSVASLLYLFSLFLRIFFHTSITFLTPLTQYLFVMAGLMGAAYGVLTNENIKIELLQKLSKNKQVRLTLRFVSLLISLLFVFIFLSHLLSEYKRSLVSDFYFKTWMLDVPYVYLFLASFVFYLSDLIKILAKSSKDK